MHRLGRGAVGWGRGLLVGLGETSWEGHNGGGGWGAVFSEGG